MIDLSGIAPQKGDIVARKNALLKAKTGDNVVLYEVLGLTVRNNVNVAYVRSVEDDNFLVINRVFVADLEVIEPTPLRKLELLKRGCNNVKLEYIFHDDIRDSWYCSIDGTPDIDCYGYTAEKAIAEIWELANKDDE